ncbi:MAG: hypothetical protein M1298_03105, partial [Chloroflexi bacterium]|nr:hypothetical protein [Chloroflexota bacterium]
MVAFGGGGTGEKVGDFHAPKFSVSHISNNSALYVFVGRYGASTGLTFERKAGAPYEQTVPMIVDCAQTLLTPQGRTFAAAHNLCNSTSKSGQSQPFNTVYGDCGSSTLYVFN